MLIWHVCMMLHNGSHFMWKPGICPCSSRKQHRNCSLYIGSQRLTGIWTWFSDVDMSALDLHLSDQSDVLELEDYYIDFLSDRKSLPVELRCSTSFITAQRTLKAPFTHDISNIVWIWCFLFSFRGFLTVRWKNSTVIHCFNQFWQKSNKQVGHFILSHDQFLVGR